MCVNLEGPRVRSWVGVSAGAGVRGRMQLKYASVRCAPCHVCTQVGLRTRMRVWCISAWVLGLQRAGGGVEWDWSGPGGGFLRDEHPASLWCARSSPLGC